MKIKEISSILEKTAPLPYAEDFDNVGLLVGDPQKEISKVLITLDCTETVVDEAIKKQAELIVTFHPVIFKGLKRIIGANYTDRVVLKAIKHNVAIYAIHTNLDFAWQGSNKELCKRFNLI